MTSSIREYTRVPIDLYVSPADIIRLEAGDEVEAFIEVDNINSYVLVNKHALQPAIQVDDNTFKVTYIMK